MRHFISLSQFPIPCSPILTALVLLPSCVTSQRQEELEQKTNQRIAESQSKMSAEINALREELRKKDATLGSIRTSSEDANRRAQGARGDLEDLKRQLLMTQGSVDELQIKFSRFVDAASKSSATQDVMVRIAEIEANQERLLRVAFRNNLILREPQEGSKPKAPPKYASSDEFDKSMSAAITQKDYKKVNSTTSLVIASSLGDNYQIAARRARGEASFLQQNYEQAAVALGEFIERAPQKHPRYCYMLLLAGDSWLYLRNNAVARTYYHECVRLAPDREECKAAKERLDRLPGG